MKFSFFRFCLLILLCFPLLSPLAQASSLTNWKISKTSQATYIHKKENNIDFALLLRINAFPVIQVTLPDKLIHDQKPETLLIKLNHALFTVFHKGNNKSNLFETTLNNQQYQQFTRDLLSQKTLSILISHRNFPLSLQGTENFSDLLNNYIIQEPNPPSFLQIPFFIKNRIVFWAFIFLIFMIFFSNLRRIKRILLILLFFRKKKKAFRLALMEIRKNTPVLTLKKSQLLYQDDYGTFIKDKWHREIQHFIKTRIRPILYRAKLLDTLPYIQKKITKEIDKAVQGKQKNKKKLQFSPSITPIEYEYFCAELLRQIGWNAKVTVASGDQGADVIATKNGRKLILQCKLYKNPVGNKAVQEINAARQFYQADYAAVVSNSTYTISARQLANATHISLLHHETLQDFANSFFNR